MHSNIAVYDTYVFVGAQGVCMINNTARALCERIVEERSKGLLWEDASILLETMNVDLGVGGMVLRWLDCYLRNRKQRMHCP